MSKGELLEQTYHLFQGQPASIAGSLVAAHLYGIDDFNDVDIFMDSHESLHFALGKLEAEGFELQPASARKMSFTHRWGRNNFHVETYRTFSPEGIEYNLSHKKLGGNSVRTLTGVLHSFDFGFLLAGYDCLAPTFEDAFLDLRLAYFPKEMSSGSALPMIPDKAQAWVRGEFGKNNAIRQAHRTAKYALRGYDMAAVVPQLVTGYQIAAADFIDRDTNESKFMGEIYLAIVEHMLLGDWEGLNDACAQLGFNEPVEHLKAVFD